MPQSHNRSDGIKAQLIKCHDASREAGDPRAADEGLAAGRKTAQARWRCMTLVPMSHSQEEVNYLFVLENVLI